MMRWSCIMLVLIFTGVQLSAQFHPDYENPAIFERNQEPPHTTLMPFASLEQALTVKRKSSPFHLSLNGTWLFRWAENPDSASRDFYKPGFDRSGWDRIRVPSNWQMEGFGYPLFRNVGLPHPLDPPEVPKAFNPVGSYYRTFVLPEGWGERHVLLHFEGVQSASRVWINGKETGYNQGGMEPAEYDITGFLKRGENSIAVKVLRYCDGSYLEDQDTWRLSGIYRDVCLMAVPEVHIRDYYMTTDLDSSYTNAILRVNTEVMNYSSHHREDLAVKIRLFDTRGQLIIEGPACDVGSLTGNGTTMVSQSFDITSPQKWSAEYPNLYTVVMELLDGEGMAVEFLSHRLGFREVEVKDQAVYVNGVAVKFNGVNSHMMHPLTGHAMDTGTMRHDLQLMKQFNINCVRTSHYPPNVEYLDLADELGIYVVDETGDEAHAYIELSGNPLWKEQYLDRMRKMVYRDRNHPSVVIWSAGNESGPGDNICALIAEGKLIDPSRPAWMYGGNRDHDPATNPIRCEDIVGPRYLQPFGLEQLFGKSDDPRPSFMDEYIAATGNSLGALDDYWKLIYRYPRLTGGAIWDWVSPAIKVPVILTRDESPGDLCCSLMNRAKLVEGEDGRALYLSGHDDWMEVARDPLLDITGESLTISFRVKPEAYNGNAAFLTKGDYQFGVIQSDAQHLAFYINTGSRTVLEAGLPDNWEMRWHHVAALYDGRKMELFVDGKIIGSRPCRGRIINAPYPVSIGKSAELRDNHRGYMCHATIDGVRIFDTVIPVHKVAEDRETLRAMSLLWLDFEDVRQEGEYYSTGIPGRTYGLVWPDRSIQPELWQLKKSPQPVSFSAVDLEKGIFEVSNRHHFRNLDELAFRWEVTANGQVEQEGELQLALPAGKTGRVTIPYIDPKPLPGMMYHLMISCTTTRDYPWAGAGHEIAWDQFELPSGSMQTGPFPSGSLQTDSLPSGSLRTTDTGQLLTINGDGFVYTFDKTSGMLTSVKIDGKELIRRGPLLNVWRAPLANDLDSWNFWHTETGYVTEGMGRETANGWRSIGLDRLEQVLDLFTGNIRENRVEVNVEASLYAMNYTTGFKVYYQYIISSNGEIAINTRVSPRGNLTKWIPKVGLQLQLPRSYWNMEWFGRGPYENYPDRKTGARIGRYTTTVEEDVVPYIIPQDYGNRCDVQWVRLTDHQGDGLMVHGDGGFNFSAWPYTTETLDRARYSFQLKDDNLVTLNLDHRVTGVGGTANSVLNPYRVFPEEFAFSFTLIPLGKSTP